MRDTARGGFESARAFRHGRISIPRRNARCATDLPPPGDGLADRVRELRYRAIRASNAGRWPAIISDARLPFARSNLLGWPPETALEARMAPVPS